MARIRVIKATRSVVVLPVAGCEPGTLECRPTRHSFLSNTGGGLGSILSGPCLCRDKLERLPALCRWGLGHPPEGAAAITSNRAAGLAAAQLRPPAYDSAPPGCRPLSGQQSHAANLPIR